MEVEATIENSLVFAGDQLNISVGLTPPPNELGQPPPVLLSGYAVVQGSFRLGDVLLSEPFADTRKAGVILGRRGIEYGSPANTGGLFAGVLDGLRHLVANNSGASGLHRGGAVVNSDDEEDDYPIFSTSQVLLFTDLQLTEPQVFKLSVDLPPDLPPTYRSRSLHITYHFIVGFERLNPGSKPMDSRLFLPFRLLPKTPTLDEPVPPKFDLRKPINAPPPRATDEKKPSDAVAEMDQYIDDLLNGKNHRNRRSSSTVAAPGARYTKVSFDISRNKTSIATLLLARPAIRVGDVLAAQIKLHRPCLHLSAYFELEEVIEEPYSAIPGHQKSGDSSDVSSTYTTYARQYLGVYGLREVSLYLPTLTSITPRLDTEQLIASWSLRLEFVGLTGYALADTEEEGDGLLAKGQVDYELFTCRIPITILPPELSGQNASKLWKL